MPTSRSLRRTHAHFSPLGFSAEKARWAAEAAAGRETRGHDAVGAEISRTRPTRGGGGGGPTDPLDPGEARFWRALPGEGDGTYVARAAALAHPVLRCFVWLHSLEHPAEEGLAPITVGHRLLFDSALVPVWSRADRADRTVSPAVCSQVKRAVDP